MSLAYVLEAIKESDGMLLCQDVTGSYVIGDVIQEMTSYQTRSDIISDITKNDANNGSDGTLLSQDTTSGVISDIITRNDSNKGSDERFSVKMRPEVTSSVTSY